MREAIEAEDWLKLYDGLEAALLEMKKFYKSSLGPSSDVSELSAGRYHSLQRGGCRHIKFHPRAYRASTLKMRKDAMRTTAGEVSTIR